MTDIRHLCPTWFIPVLDSIEFGPIGRAMKQTVEDSPYHREENTWVHTKMVLEQYLTRFYPLRSEKQNKIALFALLAHDFGKPDAEETLKKKDGSGTYRRYVGHELLSAIAFTECWLINPHLREFVSAEEARQIRWIIEHHLPYGYKDSKKRSDLRTAMEHTLCENVETFYDCLRSDAAGRISDDHQTKLQNVEDWISEFESVPLVVNKISTRMPTCYILIGPSGSGKSTWRNGQIGNTSVVVSMDDFRMDFYDYITDDPKEAYAAAWKKCNEQQSVWGAYNMKRTTETFDFAVKHGLHVIVDNVNASKKARAMYIHEARQRQMKIVAVEFWNTLGTVVRRQRTRPDKEVPENAVRRQYLSQTCAWKGSEVDEVIIVDGE